MTVPKYHMLQCAQSNLAMSQGGVYLMHAANHTAAVKTDRIDPMGLRMVAELNCM